MSTKLTSEKPTMADSQSLQLVLGASQVNDSIALYLSNTLKNKGYAFATPAALSFLSTLECGINYGSEIARNLGVSRQMVAKTVKGLCLAGYLSQVEEAGKQKKIIFTEAGERLMSDARQLLAEIDKNLSEQMSEESIKTTINSLHQIKTMMAQLMNP